MPNQHALLLAGCLALSAAASAADWPQFLGPTRNGVYPGPELAPSWPPEGPLTVWQKPVGNGFSGPVVVDHKLVLFHRLADQEVVQCLDPKTGKDLWRFPYPTAYQDDFGFDPGPRATPSIADGRVYSYGAEGMLHCLELETGKKLWSVDTKKELGAAKGFFGIACSPLVEGDAVLLNVGGTDGAGIVAFAKTTGKVLWKASHDEASYSAPIATTIHGHRYALFLTRGAFVGLEPDTGRMDFEYPFRPPIHASVSAATPLVVDDLVFISASYGAGAAVLSLAGPQPEKLWSSADVLSNHYATSVYHKGFLYGIDGRTDPGFEPGPTVRCVEFKTGKVRWKDDSVGPATITLAGDQLLILTERGELIRATATPDGFKPTARAQILPFQVRAYPALADGLLYARSKDKLVCIDLSKAR
jgi:outer membrane protein assembly factor BamB